MWNFSRYYSRQLVTNKTEPGKTGAEVTPDLATDVAKVSDDGKTYTYTLRDGVTWEDGKPITSKDVKYGIERVWAQDVLSGGPTYLKEVLDPKDEYKGPYKDKSKDKLGLKAIETPDDKTIVFKLPQANSDFEEMLALTSASPVRQDKDTKSKYGLHPFSSGPYKFESYNPGKDLTLVRNAEWKQSSDPVRKAYPDKITIKFFTNANDMDARLIAGDYDIDLAQTGLSPQGRTTALKEHKENLDNPVSGYIRYAAFPQTVKPFDNIHCRKAVLYGADHVSLQTARGGPVAGGDIGTNMLPPAVPGSEGQKYDPYEMAGANKKGNVEKAKEELKGLQQAERLQDHHRGPQQQAGRGRHRRVPPGLAEEGRHRRRDRPVRRLAVRQRHRQPLERAEEGLRHHHHGLGPGLPVRAGLRSAAVAQRLHPRQREQQLRDDRRPEDRRSLRRLPDRAGRRRQDEDRLGDQPQGDGGRVLPALRLREVHQLALQQRRERVHHRRLQRYVRLREPRPEEPQEVTGTPAVRHERQVKAGAA
ncbi:hypothetical protein RKD37_003195 [Streptomyces ambofaciens]